VCCTTQGRAVQGYDIGSVRRSGTAGDDGGKGGTSFWAAALGGLSFRRKHEPSERETRGRGEGAHRSGLIATTGGLSKIFFSSEFSRSERHRAKILEIFTILDMSCVIRKATSKTAPKQHETNGDETAA